MEDILKTNLNPYFKGEEQLIFKELFSNLTLIESVKYYGNDKSLWKYFESKETPNKLLMTASVFPNKELIERAVELGATDFNSALKTASYYGNLDVVKEMIRRGANEFRQALSYAHSGKKKEVFDFLFHNYIIRYE